MITEASSEAIIFLLFSLSQEKIESIIMMPV